MENMNGVGVSPGISIGKACVIKKKRSCTEGYYFKG